MRFAHKSAYNEWSEIWGLGHLAALIGTIDPAMQQITRGAVPKSCDSGPPVA
jgi:hypothetical protein